MGTLSFDQFRSLVRDHHRVIPVTRKLLADGETPLSAYQKLANSQPGTFLLESAENGRSWSRWSFIGVHSPAALTIHHGQLHWIGSPPPIITSIISAVDDDPLKKLAHILEALQTTPLSGLPPLSGGLVGFFSYDFVRYLEKLPELTTDDLGIAEVFLLLATDLAALDHHEGTITLIANVIDTPSTDEAIAQAYQEAIGRLDAMTESLRQSLASTVAVFTQPPGQYSCQCSAEEYHAIVDKLIGNIHAGDVFQVVASQRFTMPTSASPFDVYRILRVSNPSPYMYLLHFPHTSTQQECSIVGSSPEALVRVQNRCASTHPIAGTRWRGADEHEDCQLEKDLLADAKERAEHLMLVDLGRNDLGRVCQPGTIRVDDYSHVERYSHVMHLVSTVSGQLQDQCSALDAVMACFPAGTLTGAPKIRAMELIEQVEKTRRGLYGGIVGYLDFAGNTDFAIAIRTALMRQGVAYVQSGGGVVADSHGAYEYQELTNKARAVLSAIAAAETLESPCSNHVDTSQA